MHFTDGRIIIVTPDHVLHKALSEKIRDVFLGTVVINVLSILAIEGKLTKGQRSIVIVDIDYFKNFEAYLNRIMEIYSVQIILIGTGSFQPKSFRTAGAYIAKPFSAAGGGFLDFASRVIDAMYSCVNKMKVRPVNDQRTVDVGQKIVAIASSTGGTEALEKIFRQMPEDGPPVVAVQHMPSGFTKMFADRLNTICRMEIREAVNNDYLQKGLALIAPADFHMRIVRRNSKLAVECFAGTKIHGVMPAADVLFDSVAAIMRGNAVGVILTGMGQDGARGLYNMRANGARTIGQDKETSVIYGMPKVAFELGAVERQLPIGQIERVIMDWAR
ncbi:MAG: chemotaxis protein CheB [Clostridiales bacterium]|jgi:two-component system chemotaxis response regulator CheB|nr:chemotaxis protein CheB [Clostridiales bacterium]